MERGTWGGETEGRHGEEIHGEGRHGERRHGEEFFLKTKFVYECELNLLHIKSVHKNKIMYITKILISLQTHFCTLGYFILPMMFVASV